MILRIDLTDLEAYQIYNSIRLHFLKKSYDFAKYKFNRRIFSMDSFAIAPARSIYKQAADHFQYKGRFIPFCAVAQFYQPGLFITQALTKPNFDRALKYRGYLAGFWITFENEVQTLYPYDKYASPDVPFRGLNSHIISEIRAERISPITGVMLNKIAPTLNQKCSFEENLIQSDMLQRMKKLETFVPRIDDYNLSIGSEILRRVWSERIRS